MKQAIKAEFLTTAESARELDVTPSTVRYLANVGQLSVMRTKTGTRIYLASDVERLKRERAQQKRG